MEKEFEIFKNPKLNKELTLELEIFNSSIDLLTLSKNPTIPKYISKALEMTVKAGYDVEKNKKEFFIEAFIRYLYLKNNKLYNELAKKYPSKNNIKTWELVKMFCPIISFLSLTLFSLYKLN